MRSHVVRRARGKQGDKLGGSSSNPSKKQWSLGAMASVDMVTSGYSLHIWQGWYQMQHVRKRGIKNDSKCSNLSNWKEEIASN